jgi:hypothetical protein
MDQPIEKLPSRLGPRLHSTVHWRRPHPVLRCYHSYVLSTDVIITSTNTVKAKMVLPNNKPAPQQGTIVRSLTVPLAYGYFKRPGLKTGPFEPGRSKVFLDQAVRENRIVTGSWRKRP